MDWADAYFDRLRRLPIWQQSMAVTAAAVLCADALTYLFHVLFAHNALLLDLSLSSVITALIATPFSLILLRQAAKVEHLAEELRRASQTDHLTRLANRREFMETIGPLLTTTTNPQGEGVLLFIDADRFKLVNDTYGHVVGDKVLVNLAMIIGANIRHGDIAARVGGEEFAVFLRHAENEIAVKVAERIRLHAREIGAELGLAQDAVSVSIGIAAHRPGTALEEVLRAADRSLYVAKDEGRNRVVCQETMSSAA